MKKLIVLLVMSVMIGLPWSAPAFAEDQKAVLITGASTGLGRAMAELIASKGHFVYAGARKDSDMAELNAIENIQAIRLDVTDQAQIDAAVQTIEEAGRGLYGLINNAGVGILYPLAEVPQSELEWLIDVNVYGPVRVTRAFAPMIIASKGRISTTGSISGILSGPMYGPYSMSKHAMEAFADSLARELGPEGVAVSIIEPGNYETKIGENVVARMTSQGYDNPESPYHEIYLQLKARVESNEPSGDPAQVAEAAYQAMFSENPKRRYLVVPEQVQAEWTITKAIQELVQLNEDHPYSYSRDQLVEMLDAALAEGE